MYSPSSSSIFISRIVLGTLGDVVAFFFNFLLLVPVTYDSILVILGAEGESSSTCVAGGGTLSSSSSFPSSSPSSATSNCDGTYGS